MILEELHELIQTGVDTGAFPGACYAVILPNKRYMNYVGLKAKYPTVAFIDYIHSIDLQDPREGFGKCT